MKQSVHIRRLTRGDLPFADEVRHLAGWNQTLKDWERFLATEPEGCFLAEWNGTPAGTATTTVYGPALAWIGMVLVHPDCRGRGVGRALVRHCVEHLRGQGIACIKLDATPFGETIYDRLGFKTEWTLARWSGAGSGSLSRDSGPRLRPWRLDEQSVDALDAGAFGVSRRRLLTLLAPQCLSAIVWDAEPNGAAGFGMIRPGSRATYLGPVVASSDRAGLELIEELVGRSQGQNIYWDIPDLNVAAVSWAEQHGFTKQRSLTRMFLGVNQFTGDPRQQFALSGPETG